MRTTFPILKRFALFVFLPIVVLLSWLYVHARSELPPAEQVLQVPGGGTVRIFRDAQGVPHLIANKDEDIYFAMGYAQAQDRLWQMELERRLAAGRLSEIFGQDLLMQDSWMRTLGLRQSSQSAFAALSEPARQSLTAYAKGVNQWLQEQHPLPLEFTVFGIRPEAWTEIDSLSCSKLFALNLASNLDQEIGKAVALRYLRPAQVKLFFPGNDLPEKDNPSSTLASLTSLGALSRSLHLDWQVGGREVGSNAWVVSGRYTADKSALLANDPHLGLQIPSVWYPVVQHGKQLQAQGMSLVGMPPVIFGQNGRIAWGGTSMMADVQDLAIERFATQDSTLYLADGKWLPVNRHEEEIVVASPFPAFLREKLQPVRIAVLSTRNGPLISEMQGKAIGEPVALRWTALQAGDVSYESMYAVSYATDWASFKESFHNYVAPALNMLYADRDGNIGYLGIGKIPLRKAGDGSMPVPGWDSSYAWDGSIPFDAMPSQYNPPSGYIVSANNRPVDDSYPYFISNNWAPPARADRIKQLLDQEIASHHPLTLSDMQTIQLDVLSLSARQLLPSLLSFKPVNDDERKALDLLKNWSGDMGASSAQAALFNVWMHHLSVQLFSSALSDDWTRREQQSHLRGVFQAATPDQIREALNDANANWCDPHSDETQERSCQRLLQASLDQALAEMHKRMGGDESDWRWGSIHYTLYANEPFSRVKGMAALFERKVASGGGPDCVDVSGFSEEGSDGYIGRFGSTSRQLIAIGPHGVRHEYINSTGESGNWMSSHYADMVYPFAQGKYYDLKDGDAQ